MRIINDKGMLFNRINIIDFLVLLFVLCLLPMFYFGWKIMNTSTEPPEPTTITVDKAEYSKLSNQIKEFLKEHKRARKYFEKKK